MSTSDEVHYSRPDVKQMVSFKPSMAHGLDTLCKVCHTKYYLLGVGMNAVPGGHFPLPSGVIQLMSILPPPQSFQVYFHSLSLSLQLIFVSQGPFVHVDELIELIVSSSIPEVSNSCANVSTRVITHKRRRDDGEEEDETAPPPSNDLYISRQQKRVQTSS